jgi:selenide,water dikinase
MPASQAPRSDAMAQRSFRPITAVGLRSGGSDVSIPANFTPAQLALLTDPQTSGGLLVSCDPDCVQEVLDIFNQHHFLGARVIGQMGKPQAKPLVIS